MNWIDFHVSISCALLNNKHQCFRCKMGISKVPIAAQVKLFQKHKSDLYDGRRAKPCSAEIYKTLSKTLGMTAAAIRMSVVRRTNEILGSSTTVQLKEETVALLDQSTESENEKSQLDESVCSKKAIAHTSANESIEINEQDESIEPHEEQNESSEQHEACDEDDVNPQQIKRKTISFVVNVDSKQIFDVQEKTQGKKKRVKAAAGWGWRLRKVLWDNFKTQCFWLFKSADPKVNGDVTCKGGCKYCGASINIRFVAGESMNVEIRNYDSSKSHPQQKCRLSTEGKAYFANLVRNSSAHLVHINEANLIMEKGDPVPAHLPSENALRLIKCRDENTSTSTSNRFSKDALWALVELKCESYPDVIREISIYPFCVRYALPMQEEAYNLATKRKRSVVSLDATGTGLRTFRFLPVTTKKKMPVFLYTMGCHSTGKTIPIYQVLSDKHTLGFHVGWLTEWARKNKNVDEIIMDDSAALIGACVQAFTRCLNTNEYISQCWDCLLFDASPPRVFIRLDRSHVVKSLHRLEILNKEDIRIRVLVKRVIGLLIVCESLDVAKITIRELFTVIRSEFATRKCMESLENLKSYCGMDGLEEAPNAEHENNKGTGYISQLKDNDDSYKSTTSYKYGYYFA